MKVGVRYCGGCNPRYDRVQVVNRLKELLSEVTFVTADASEEMDAVLVVSGCATRCTRTEDLALPENRLIPVAGFEDMLPARDAIRSLGEEEKGHALTKEEVLQLLPHKDPMLFLDEVEALTPGVEISASFTPGPSHPVFAGHFPGNPVFPGTLLIEAMAQAADVMLLATDRFKGKTPYLFSVEKAAFRSPMHPGDTVRLKAVFISEQKEMGVTLCKCTAVVNDRHAADAEIYLAMR